MSAARKMEFDQLMSAVASRLLGEPNAALSRPPSNVRHGTHGSLSIDLEKGVFFDHEAKVGGGVLESIEHWTGRSRGEAMAWLQEQGLIDSAKSPMPLELGNTHTVARRVVATYPYRDEQGGLLYEVVRYEPKKFLQRRRGQNGECIWNLNGVTRVLYRLPEVVKSVRQNRTIYVCEGEKDVHSICNLGFEATTCSEGAGKWQPSYNEFLRGADVLLLPDNDRRGREHVDTIARALHGVASRIRVLDLASVWQDCPDKGDISDWLEQTGGTAEQLAALIEALPSWSPSPEPAPRLRPLTIAELFQLKIKPREQVLDPIIPEKGLVMLYASRGTGKTHVALGIAFAVATGTAFLKWSAPKPRRVLLIDGEMPAGSLQDRLASIVAGDPNANLDPEYLKVLAGDLIEDGGIGNLASPQVQAELEPWLDGIDLLVLDNLSSLTAVIRDNDAESWGPIQEWLLRLRRRGISVLIVHHAGKGGQQRGTSRREDVLDTSISLRRPSDYDPTEGARFEVHLEKARSVAGAAAKPFEAELEVRNGMAFWTVADVEDSNKARVAAMLDDGMSVRDIADETGISKSTVHRIKAELDKAGDVHEGD